jgi:hypothetical protein
MTDHLHISTSNANPGCGNRGPTARITGIPDLVTCPRCKLSTTCRNARRYRAAQRRPLSNPAGMAVKAAASLYLRRALKIIERLPMRRTS